MVKKRETAAIADIGSRPPLLASSTVDEASPAATDLAAIGLNDMMSMLEDVTHHPGRQGALTARLIELGGEIEDGTGDAGQAYREAMRLQGRRLAQDPSARRDLAMHPRTYGRPARQLVTEADSWVVPMVEAEIMRMSGLDLERLRENVIMRVGRQHDVHPDFRPLILRLATDDRTLACLASIGQGRFGGQPSRSYLLAAVAGPFIDVIMKDPDEGIELEAAAWDFVQRHLASTGASPGRLIQAVREASSLLALIDTSRALAARQSDAQAHAGFATRSAIAEFVLSNLVLLATRPKAALAGGRLEIGAFVRRDLIGRSPVDIPEDVWAAWAAERTARRLLLDLVLVTMMADHERFDLPSMPHMSHRDVKEQGLRHLAEIEQGTLGKMAKQALDSGWHLGDWAGAA
jgi:hypothetical protein